ncbi:MAG: hypothetical protein VX472_01620 [Bacteroidota bacterium]|nr:hypothetical protein [Bacteroidota bacterium]
MLNTFFFGYLPLKWKRLARVLSIILFLPSNYLLFAYASTGKGDEFDIIFWEIDYILLIPVINYTLKPFVVK